MRTRSATLDRSESQQSLCAVFEGSENYTTTDTSIPKFISVNEMSQIVASSELSTTSTSTTSTIPTTDIEIMIDEETAKNRKSGDAAE